MAVKIEKRSFGKTARGENVTLFEIGTPELTARVLDYGATVQALLVTDQDGKRSTLSSDTTRSRAMRPTTAISARVSDGLRTGLAARNLP